MSKKLRNIFDNYSQTENHLTHSLLQVLNQNRILLAVVLKHFKIKLTGKQINLLSQVAPKNIKERESIPDGYIYSNDFNECIGIETKIKADALNEAQLTGHLKQLSEYERSFLIVLTPDETEPEIIQNLKLNYKNIYFISWQDLLKIMAKQGPDSNKDVIGKYLFDQFMSYIERAYHMTPFTGINFSEGYDSDLAIHYVKRLSAILTPEIKKLYPKCTKQRPKITGTWEAWYSTAKVQDSVHCTLSVHPDNIACHITLANGCSTEWKNFNSAIHNPKLTDTFKNLLKEIYKKATDGADRLVSFRQRHYIGMNKPIPDAVIEINIAVLLGIERSKMNDLWWETLKEFANTKNKFNYQLEIGYKLKYEEVPELKSEKAINTILQCYKNLQPVYSFLTRDRN